MTKERENLEGSDGDLSRGDRGDFAELFERSFRVLWLIACGAARQRSLAEDIVQEAAVIALGKFDEFQQGTNFTAWMGQIVRNVALNIARKEGRRRMAPLDEQSGIPVLASGDGTDLGWIRSGSLPDAQAHFDDRVVRALAALGETPRACLLLRTIGELDYSEISQLLDIPQGTAMSHVHRTRHLLRERLAGDTSWTLRGHAGTTSAGATGRSPASAEREQTPNQPNSDA